jgi:hypothetical protein
MSEHSWVLKGIDPAARQHAVEEAARRGVPLGDYLTDIVLQNALAEQMRENGATLLKEFDGVPPASAQPGDGFAARRRVKDLERRLGTSATRLDGALNALDTWLSDLSARVGDVEGLAGDTAHALSEQVKDLHGGLATLRLALSSVEDAAGAESQANVDAHAVLADACGELERRLETVEAIARGADRAVDALADAQQAYRLAVAEDMKLLSRETIARLSAGLDQVREAAYEAAAEADAAAAHLIAELRGLRQSIDERLAASAAETKHRMQAAFAEAADRIATLSDRVAINERQAERQTEQLRAAIADAENGAQATLEETALSLRRADAVLAADIVRMGENNRTALDLLRSDLGAEAAAMHKRQLSDAARIASAEARIAAVVEAGPSQHEKLERRFCAINASLRDALDQAETAVAEQFDAAASRTAELEQDIAHVRRTLGAEINRVESCTLAALEKQSQDRASGDAGLSRALDDMRQRLGEQAGALASHQASTEARLDRVDAALASDGPIATVVAATADEVASLRARVLGIQTADREVAERIAKLETADGEASKALDMLRGHLANVAAQAPAGQVERLHNLELSVADLRLNQLASGSGAASSETVAALESRVSDFEARQASALDALRSDIAHFINENERRFAVLEASQNGISAPFAAIEQRLTELEHRDIGAAFAELRARIEDRILGVEQRNVRTLEQLSDTVSLIERRLLSDEQDEEALSA